MNIITIKPDINYIIKAQLPLNNTRQTAGIVYIENGSIVAITPVTPDESNYEFKNPRRSKIELDLKQLTLMPPLVDCHVHLALDGVDFGAARRRWAWPDRVEGQIKSQLKDTLSCGILALRDGGDLLGLAGAYANGAAEGTLTEPLIKASFFGLRPPGSYGSFIGPNLPMEQVAAMLDQLVLLKAGQVKVIVSGVVSFKEYGRVGALHYAQPQLNYIVRLAKERGLSVMAHASSDPAVAMAVAAGVDTIEHGYFVQKSTLEQMAAKNTAWVPTVIPVAAQLEQKPDSSDNLDKSSRYVIEKTVHSQLAAINSAAALGVTLGVGTDAGATGVRHGFSYYKELELYQKAGLAAPQIYQSAAVSSAAILKLPWGQITPGHPAAFIAVQGHPRHDITALGRVRYTFLPATGTVTLAGDIDHYQPKSPSPWLV